MGRVWCLLAMFGWIQIHPVQGGFFWMAFACSVAKNRNYGFWMATGNLISRLQPKIVVVYGFCFIRPNISHKKPTPQIGVSAGLRLPGV